MGFLRDITLGQYVATDSSVHRLDPRTKFLSVFLLMLAVLVSHEFLFYFLLTGFLAVIIPLARLPVRLVLRNFRPFSWLILLTICLHIFFTRTGTVLFCLGPIQATSEGVARGAFFSCRLLILIVTATLLTLTTSPMELVDGIEKLLKPFRRIRVPAHELAMMTSIALRFIPTLIDEADRLRKAQLARGASFSGGALKRIRNLLPLVVPLFVSAFHRADQLAIAMESRCYRGGEGRTSFKELKLHKSDFFSLGVVFLLLVIGVIWR
ncbi:MAG: energy-coupling factor transporter transmembrane protein EcfT [Candidatus Latescibacteria bacterium]|nr:energy-coupling factor transporter transmembrane protein EcfT [Candidatus Latescibacterota bacterium]